MGAASSAYGGSPSLCGGMVEGIVGGMWERAHMVAPPGSGDDVCNAPLVNECRVMPEGISNFYGRLARGFPSKRGGGQRQIGYVEWVGWRR